MAPSNPAQDVQQSKQTPSNDATKSTAPTTQPSAAALEEDDEFEDFPVDDWPTAETEAAATATDASNKAAAVAASAATGTGSGQQEHLWEESWDDDDTADDFSKQLKEELGKVEGSKRR